MRAAATCALVSESRPKLLGLHRSLVVDSRFLANSIATERELN